MKIVNRVIVPLLITSTSLISACSSEVFTEEVTYRGKTEAASLTESNMQSIAYKFNTAIQYLIAQQTPIASYYYEEYDSTSYDNLYQLNPTTSSSGHYDCYPDGNKDCGLYSYPSTTIAGSCGQDKGTLKIQTDKQYYSVKSNISFQNFCDRLYTGLTTDYRFYGDIASEGQYYFPSQNFTECRGGNTEGDLNPDRYDACVKLQFEALTHKRISQVTLADLSTAAVRSIYTASGEIDLNYDDFAISRSQNAGSAEANLTLRNLDNDKLIKLENFKVSWALSNSGQYTSVTVSGRMYDADLGYVTVSTVTSADIDTTNGFPASGRILLEGSNKILMIDNGANISLTIGNDPVGGDIDSTSSVSWNVLERSAYGL